MPLKRDGLPPSPCQSRSAAAIGRYLQSRTAVRYGGGGCGVVHQRRAGRKVLRVQGLELAYIDAAAAGTSRRRASSVGCALRMRSDRVPHKPQAWLMVIARLQAYAALGSEDALALRWRDRAVVAAQLRVARAVISMARWRPAIPLALVRPCAYRSIRVVARISRTSSLAVASVMVSSAGAVVPRAVTCPRSRQASPSRTSSVDRKVICGWSRTCRNLADLTSLSRCGLLVAKLAASITADTVEDVTGSPMVIWPETRRKVPFTGARPNMYLGPGPGRYS